MERGRSIHFWRCFEIPYGKKDNKDKEKGNDAMELLIVTCTL